MKKAQGFTLIELMIVVVIIAILAAVALPNYSDYVTRSRITEATSSLSGSRVQMEQFFMDNRTYSGAALCTARNTTGKYFNVYAENCAADGYTLKAEGKSGGSMEGFVFSVDQANAQSSTVSGGPTGWSGNDSCWITKKGGQC